MLVRTALARLRAQAPRRSARDVAHISRQLAHTYLKSSTVTTQLAIAPAVKGFRAYATATRTKPKPKAKATTKKSPAKKSPAKKTATRKTATRKTATKKPVKKRAVKKAVKKPALKRKVLTERQKMLKQKAKERANIAQLKATALKEPKGLPRSAWTIYMTDYHRSLPADDRNTVTEAAKKAAVAFKNLSPSELERLQNQAEQNLRRNKENHVKWIRSHTPKQILEANRARAYLKKKLAVYKKHKIQDDRLVKAPKPAFLLYYVEAIKRPDTADLLFGDRAKKIAQEWKDMSASQKQKWEDAARTEKERYVKEYRSLYGEDPGCVLKAKASTQ